MYQIIRGLADKEAMERVLQLVAQVEGGELSLARVTKLFEALEMGKQSQQLVHSAIIILIVHIADSTSLIYYQC